MGTGLRQVSTKPLLEDRGEGLALQPRLHVSQHHAQKHLK